MMKKKSVFSKSPSENEPILEVRKKLARLSAFTELNPRPVIEIDFKGNILDLNSSAIEFFPDLQKKGAKHTYLSDLKNVIKALKRASKPFGREIKIGEKWFKQRFYYIPSFKLIHIYGSDVTERKKTEDALKKSELRYRSLFNKMNEGYALKEIIWDKKGNAVDFRFLDINPAYEDFTKLSRVNIIGKTAKHIFGKKEPDMVKEYGQVIRTSEPLHLERYYEDRSKYYEIFAHKTEGNQFAVLFFDITDRKRAEEEKNNFISIMSHELRNPLTPILTNSQLIRAITKDNEGVNPLIKEAAGIIERQSKNMAQLLDDILDISKMSREKILLQRQTVNICDVIKNAIETTMPLIRAQGQELSVFFQKSELYANVDPLRFEQIIINLINNASKYTKAGGHIQVVCTIVKRGIETRVKDNGIGMEPSKIGKMFELFDRASGPAMKIGGMGIGLNLVKNLVAMHQGKITARSAGKNKGSEFIVTIPLTSKKNKVVVKKTAVIKKPANKEGTRNILIVDDNEDIASTLNEILKNQGYITKIGHNGESALKILKTFKADVALIDIRMPGMGGYALARAIRKQFEKPKMTLIALTGYGQENDKKLSKQAGFDHHVTKPVDIDHLTRLIS